MENNQNQIPEWLHLLFRDFSKKKKGLICQSNEFQEVTQELVYVFSGSCFSLPNGKDYDLLVTLVLDENPRLLLTAWKEYDVSSSMNVPLLLKECTLSDFKRVALELLNDVANG